MKSLIIIVGAFVSGWLVQDWLTEKPEVIIQKKSVTVQSAAYQSCVFAKTERLRGKIVDLYLCGKIPVQVIRETYEVAM